MLVDFQEHKIYETIVTSIGRAGSTYFADILCPRCGNCYDVPILGVPPFDGYALFSCMECVMNLYFYFKLDVDDDFESIQSQPYINGSTPLM